MNIITIKIKDLFDAISEYECHQFEYNKEYNQKESLKIKDENGDYKDIKFLIKKNDDSVYLKFSNNVQLRCAKKHKISYNLEDCVFAENLKVNDSVVLSDSSVVKLKEIVDIGEQDLYDLNIDTNTHLYQTSNKLVHHNTTVCLSIIAQCQKNGGAAAFVDAEHALDPLWARNIGVDTNELLISQPNCGEEALDIAETLVLSKAVDVIVVDSVAALVPRAEINGDFGDSHMGLQARLMSQAMRKLTALIAKSNCTIIFINQIRMKIGVTFGSPETTTGGEALKFYASLRIECRRQLGQSEKSDEDGMSIAVIKVKLVKNKVAPPFKVTLLHLYTGVNGIYGFDTVSEIFDLGVEHDLIKKAGAWFSYGEDRMQGKTAVIDWLRKNPEIQETIKNKVLNNIEENNEPVIGSFEDIQNNFRDATEAEIVEEQIEKGLSKKEKRNEKRKKRKDEDSDSPKEIEVEEKVK